MRLGVHVSIAGGIREAVVRAKRLSCTTMQIFSRSPRGGTAAPLSPSECQRFDAERRAADLTPLAVHAPYIINLASPEATMWKRSVALYRDEYARAAALNARYLVTHVGSHRGAGEAAGMARVARAMTQTLAGVTPTTMILLENTAGSGQGLGMTFEELAAIRDAIRPKRYVGICLDTAHLFAAGFPIHTEKGLEQMVASFDRIVGREHLKLIHLNDSKVPFNSRVDRHWHIGQGHIGLAAFRRIVNHPQLKDLPFILETPKRTDTDDLENLATVRKLTGRPPRPALRPARFVSLREAKRNSRGSAGSPPRPVQQPRSAGLRNAERAGVRPLHGHLDGGRSAGRAKQGAVACQPR